MRNLTLCVLLIVVGTLAALPFRQKDDPQTTAPPAGEATGPSLSEFGQTNRELFIESESPVRLDTLIPAGLPQWTVPQDSSARPHMPKSFDDIAVPLKTDAFATERLSMSATKQRKHQVAKPAATDLAGDRDLLAHDFQKMPKTLPMSSAPQNTDVATTGPRFGTSRNRAERPNQHRADQPRSVLMTSPDSSPSRSFSSNQTDAADSANATLASASSAASRVDSTQTREAFSQLPRSNPPERQRHWIRQPD